MKKAVKFILLACFVVGIFSACGAQTAEEFNSDFMTNEGGAVDLGGMKIKYTVALDSTNGVATQENVLGYPYNTNFSDLALQRIRDVETQYNMTLEMNHDDSFADKFKMASAAATALTDALLSPSLNFFSWAKAGFLVGISTLSDYIDYTDSDKWGSPNILESAFYKDDLYGLTPAAWPEQNYTSFGYPLVANVDMILSTGAGDPREFVENKQWTWDQFHHEIEICTIQEGGETKQYGMVTSYPYMAQMIILSNGVHFLDIDANGEPYCGYYTDAGRRAIEEVINLWRGDYKYTISPKEGYLSEVVTENFVNGDGVYAFLPTHFIFGVYGEVAMKLDNFAILPTPTGPDVDPGYVASCYHTMSYNISFSAMSDNVEAAAIVLNAIYEPLPGYETREEIKDYMMRNYFFDTRDADAFFDLFENCTYNYDYTTNFESRRIPEYICTTNKTGTQVLEEQESVIANIMEEYIKPTIEAYEYLFPDFVR